jgi:hypothetical protein
MLLAEKWQSFSAGQERQFVALPAAGGFRARLKCDTLPKEAMLDGVCGFPVGEGAQSSHMRKSMSWQDFVRRVGPDVCALRQLPLPSVSLSFV